MKKLIIAWLSLWSILAQAQIQVQVDPSQIGKGETFQLTISQDNPNNRAVPDLTVLQKDFAILGTEQNMNYSVINGQTQSSNQWIIMLRPKQSGILTIPAITVGASKTTPVTINVSEAATTTANVEPNNTDKNEDVMLVATVNEKMPYVNQQITYTVKLYNRKRLLDVDYQPPQVADALIIPLGDAKRYQTSLNGKEYIVEEQNYAIFPQKSGSLKIASPVFSALIYDFNPQRINVQDKPSIVKVKPIPSDFKGSTWAPAKQISLSEQYENSSQSLAQGSTLIRTITLEGTGIPAQLLPPVSFDEGKEFNVYSEKGDEHNQIQQGQLVGTATTKVTYLFKEPGKVTIPQLQVTWFNTTTGAQEVAVLPARSFDITAAANASPSHPVATAPSEVTNNPQTVSRSEVFNKWPWLFAAVFAVAWLLTLLLWMRQKKPRSFAKGEYKKALTAVQKACVAGEPEPARQAILHWAALHWPDAKVLNLSDISQLVRDAHLQKQLQALSQALYKQNQKGVWRGDELAQCIAAVMRKKPERVKRSEDLPPMNPG